jgi:hypothetical protein
LSRVYLLSVQQLAFHQPSGNHLRVPIFSGNHILALKDHTHRGTSRYTESEQVCEFLAAVPLGITETKRKMLRILFKFQYNSTFGQVYAQAFDHLALTIKWEMINIFANHQM